MCKICLSSPSYPSFRGWSIGTSYVRGYNAQMVIGCSWQQPVHANVNCSGISIIILIIINTKMEHSLKVCAVFLNVCQKLYVQFPVIGVQIRIGCYQNYVSMVLALFISIRSCIVYFLLLCYINSLYTCYLLLFPNKSI